MHSKATIVLATFLLGLSFSGQVKGYMVNNNPYNRVESLDPKGNFHLEWLVDWNAKRVTFKVTVATVGYVGFGLTKNGAMEGADIVIGGVLPNRTTYFSDRHGVGHEAPVLDQRQDWKLLSARETPTHTFLSFSRPFETCDPQDYPITANRISLIWAYGETDDAQIYHHQNRGVFHVYILQPDYSPQVIRPSSSGEIQIVGRENSDLKVWTITPELRLPAADTTYWCTMHKAPKLPRKHHIVGFEVTSPNEVSRQHTHHLLLMKCHAPPGLSASDLFEPFVGRHGQLCYGFTNPAGPMLTEYCTDAMQVWALGGRIFFNPPHVGVAFGEAQDEYYLVQIHYNNPLQLPNLDVGVRLDVFYTDKLRPFEGGMVPVRVPSPGLTPSILLPPSTVSHTILGHCAPECTRKFLSREGIIFFAMHLHSHTSGQRIRLHHFRNNEELPWIANDDNYAFNYQQFRVLREERKILPGDQISVRCVYDNTWTNDSVVAGFTSKQEMCLGYAYYYNKIAEFQLCGSQIDSEEVRKRFLGISNVTWNYPDIEFVADPGEPFAGHTVSEVSDNHVKWNLRNRADLQRMHLTQPQTALCRKQLFAFPAAPRSLPRDKHGVMQSPDSFTATVEYPFQVRPYQPPPTC